MTRARGRLGVAGDLGFVILHRCGEDFYFLLVCTWRNENELWETVWAKDGDADVFFRPWAIDGAHRPTFCVWELGAVVHERRGMEPVPPVAARRGCEARVPPRLLRRARLMATVPDSGRSCSSSVSRGGGPVGLVECTCASRSSWTEHAQFMNGLVDDGLILLGGPVEGGRDGVPRGRRALRVDALRARFAEDPSSAERDADRTSVERRTILLSPED